jgi:hypothetical protein
VTADDRDRDRERDGRDTEKTRDREIERQIERERERERERESESGRRPETKATEGKRGLLTFVRFVARPDQDGRKSDLVGPFWLSSAQLRAHVHYKPRCR